MLKIRFIHCVLLLFISVSSGFTQVHKEPAPPDLMHQPPLTNFVIYNLCSGSPVLFKNISLSATSYTWTVYEEGPVGTYTTSIKTSYDTDLSYLFPHKGNFQVDLWAYNGHLSTVSKIVTNDSLTKANFEYSLCQGKFLNLSQCASTYYWNFGDGFTSTEHSPVHYYNTAGTYTATLKATEGTKTDSVKISFVASPNNLTGKFTYFSRNDTVIFTAQDSSTSLLDYYWTYGDGAKDLVVGNAGKYATHVYPNTWDSTFYAFLLVRSTCHTAYSFSQIHVNGATRVKGTLLFPNPSESGIVHMETDNKINLKNLKVFNCIGQKMNEIIVTETLQGYDIDISLLPKGIYFVSLDFYVSVINTKILRN